MEAKWHELEGYSKTLEVAHEDYQQINSDQQLGWCCLVIYSYVYRECERAKREKHVLDGATLIPLVMTTFGKLGPSAESYLKSVADVACSTGCVDLGVWLRIAKQFLSCASVRGRGILFRHYYQSIASVCEAGCLKMPYMVSAFQSFSTL